MPWMLYQIKYVFQIKQKTCADVCLCVCVWVCVCVCMCVCVYENPVGYLVYKKDYIFNQSRCSFKTDKYLKSIIGVSVVTYVEIIGEVGKLYKKPTKIIKIIKNYNIKK